MSSKFQLLTRQIIVEGKLEEYSEEVISILNKIEAEGCKTYPHTYSESSWFSYEGTVPTIRLSLLRRSSATSIIWDLLHEYGHFLSGPTENNKTDTNREILAWDFAEKEIQSYPRLSQLVDDFKAHKAKCLGTYGV